MSDLVGNPEDRFSSSRLICRDVNQHLIIKSSSKQVLSIVMNYFLLYSNFYTLYGICGENYFGNQSCIAF